MAAPRFSDDQAQAWDRIADLLRAGGADIDAGHLVAPAPSRAARGSEPPDAGPRRGAADGPAHITTDGSVEGAAGQASARAGPGREDPPRGGPPEGGVFAVTGKAGSGKTMLLASLVEALREAGFEIVTGDHEPRRRRERRTLAVLAPTNKAASVLRQRGVPATTIHRVLYTPIYAPEYEHLAEWLTAGGSRPRIDGLTEAALDRAAAFFATNRSVPGAMAAAGLRGSDFIRGWKRREDPLDLGLVDEASMLDQTQLEDLRTIFPTLMLFGDPAQLAPVGQSGTMVFDRLPSDRRASLSRIHRQAQDNPILDLAHALADPALDFEAFEALVASMARRDDRVRMAARTDADLMARSPVLVWRNATRVRLIAAFRQAHSIPADALAPGEPLICDGIELPPQHRRRRIELEARGLIKGAQVVYLGAGKRPGFARLHILGADDPLVSAAAIIKIERPDADDPLIATAAQMGAAFLHGAAVTIHKAQGSQWPDVQVYAPDLWAAARTGRSEAGIALWKRLAYVAITRAEERLHWVTRPALGRPARALGTEDLPRAAVMLALDGQDPD